MTEFKAPKLSLVQGKITPATKESKMPSLNSFMKFAQDISHVEHGVHKSEVRTAQVSGLASLKTQASDDRKMTHPSKNPDRS